MLPSTRSRGFVFLNSGKTTSKNPTRTSAFHDLQVFSVLLLSILRGEDQYSYPNQVGETAPREESGRDTHYHLISLFLAVVARVDSRSTRSIMLDGPEKTKGRAPKKGSEDQRATIRTPSLA